MFSINFWRKLVAVGAGFFLNTSVGGSFFEGRFVDGKALGIARYTSQNPVPRAQGMLHQDGGMKNDAVCIRDNSTNYRWGSEIRMTEIHHVFVSRGENVLKMEVFKKILLCFLVAAQKY